MGTPKKTESCMGLLKKETFVCLDCETTGLDIEKDEIIEVGVVVFTFDGTLETYETLVQPRQPIQEENQAIHGISNEMVDGQPYIEEVLPKVFSMIRNYPIVGHGIEFDIKMLAKAAKKHKIPTTISSSPFIDTLRLARLYGESPRNSLEVLRDHFNIQEEGAHRAMNDVVVNISVFKHLTNEFKTLEQIQSRLSKPIELKAMPLGKHKGRPLREVPIEYLRWACSKDFDQDLKFSIRREMKRREKGSTFQASSNPFRDLSL